MFRELLRKKQALTREECDQVLENALRGVLAVNGDDGYPYALPINFYYDKTTGKIYFHSGKVGYKVDCLKNSKKASFTAEDAGGHAQCTVQLHKPVRKDVRMVMTCIGIGQITCLRIIDGNKCGDKQAVGIGLRQGIIILFQDLCRTMPQ